MAYINSDTVKAKRQAIKAAFPVKDGWKFSITGGNSSTLSVKIIQHPHGYHFPNTGEIYDYPLDGCLTFCDLGEQERGAVARLLAIMAEGHWDRSDIMTDYFRCAYYYYLTIGSWNKPVQEAA